MNSTHHFHIHEGDEIKISSSDIGLDTVVFRINEVTFYVPTARVTEFVYEITMDWSEMAKQALASQV